MFIFAETTSAPATVQLTAIQAVAGLAVILVAVGAAWGSLKTSLNHLGEDLTEVKAKINNRIEPNLQDVRERLTAVEVYLSREGFRPESFNSLSRSAKPRTADHAKSG